MDKKSSSLNNNLLYYLSIIFICGIYLFLRLNFKQTIEFGYDQPILANTVINFIKNPTFINSVNFVGENSWGYVSWGPMQIFFYAPFFLFSKDPLLISLAVSVFNILSIVFVFMAGSKFFSKSVGLIAALILATHPWWIIFSRMIYQPTPSPTFIALAIFLTFEIISKEKSKLIAPLIVIWSVLAQLYIHTLSFLIVSVPLITLNFKKFSKTFLLIGIFFASVLFLPYLIQKNDLNLSDSSKSEFVQERDNFSSRINLITPGYFKILSGGDYKWQLGYAYEEFYKLYPSLTWVEKSLVFLTILIVLENLIASIIKQKNKLFRKVLILWTIAPILFLSVLNLPNVLPIPRYFLISLPSFSLLFGLFVEDIYELFKRREVYTIPLLVSSLWIFTIVCYFNFVKQYDYPEGPLSTFSDVPYSFTKDSMNFILDHASNSGYKEVVVSGDIEKPKEYSLNGPELYIWSQVLKKDTEIREEKSTGYYVMDYDRDVDLNKFHKKAQFGPYLIYEYLESGVN